MGRSKEFLEKFEVNEKSGDIGSMMMPALDDIKKTADGLWNDIKKGEIKDVTGARDDVQFLLVAMKMVMQGMGVKGAGKHLEKARDLMLSMAEENGELDEKERTKMDDLIDLKDKYDGKWLDFQVTDSKESKYGKGFDITAKQSKYNDLPPLIQTDMVKKELKKGDKFKATLYISAGGILIDKVK